MFSEVDNAMMDEALNLAAKGEGAVEPNPTVGCVIVREGQIIGRGYHQKFSGPHAEIEAIMDALGCDEATARYADNALAGATAYVTLEPCSHHGKTPPCCTALIAAGISRVVAAMDDPDPHVSGRGFERLIEKRVKVEVGCREPQAVELLRAYLSLQIKRRPWVILKWAQTADGFWNLAPGVGGSISGEESHADVQRLRAICDGIAVGIGTVLADDPLLTNRTGAGRTPTRIVLDTHLKITPSCRLMRSISDAPLLIATTAEGLASEPAGVLQALGAQLLVIPELQPGRLDFYRLMDVLGKARFTRLLVEGGPTVAADLLAQGLADEVMVFTAPLKLAEINNPDPSANKDALAGIDRILARFDYRHIPRAYVQTISRPSGADTLRIFRRG